MGYIQPMNATVNVNIRFTARDYRRIAALAKLANLRPGQWIRAAAILTALTNPDLRQPVTTVNTSMTGTTA